MAKNKGRVKKQIRWLAFTWLFMVIGLVIFKYIPMEIYGKYILFDASSHIVWTSFGLYVLWFFIDQNKTWRIPFLIFSAVVLVLMGFQRIVALEHNEIGVLMGLFVAFFSIVLPRWKEFRSKLEF